MKRREFAGGAIILVLLAGSLPAAQPLAIPDAKTALSQEQYWMSREATASLVPYAAALPKVSRWTIDTRLHRGIVAAAALSPDATRIATGNVDGILRIWSLPSGTLEQAVIAHRWSIGQVVWSPNGEMVATNSGSDNVVRIFDTKTWKTIAELPGVYGSLTWSADSGRLAGGAGSSGGLFISSKLEKFANLKDVGQSISALAWSPDGRIALAAASNGAMVVDSSTGRMQCTFEDTDQSAVTRLAWSPDGRHVAAIGPAMAAIFEASNGKRVKELGRNGERVAWSADGKQVVVASGTGVSLVPFPGDEKPRTLAVRGDVFLGWKPDSTQFIAVNNLRVESWRPDGQAAEYGFPVSGGRSPPLFAPGKPIVAGLGTPNLSLWDPTRMKRTRRLEGQGPVTTIAAWSPTKKTLAFGDEKGTVRIWQDDEDEPSAAAPLLKAAVRLLSWSADGKALAAAGPTGPVQVWWPETGETKVLGDNKGPVPALAWGRSSAELATSGTDEKILVWDVEAGSPKKTITGPCPVTALEWDRSPTLAVGLRDRGLLLVNPATGQTAQELIPPIRGAANPINTMAWIPGGPPRLLFWWAYGHTVQAIDAASTVRFQRQLAPGGVAWVSALSNGLAVTASLDRTVRFWNIADGKLAGFLVDDGGSIAAISATGDVAFDTDAAPDLIAVVDLGDRQEWVPLEAFAKAHGWKNKPKSIRLPAKP